MRRRGYLLVEALCALALGGLLAAAAAGVLSGTRAALVRIEERLEGERVAQEALGVAAGLVGTSDSVAILADTAVDLSVRLASGVACHADSLELWLAPRVAAGGDGLTAWSQRPDVGDEVAVLVRDSVTGLHGWRGETLDGVVDRVPQAPCDADHGWIAVGNGASRITVLRTRTRLPGVVAGSPVRVLRRMRLALYVDGRGEWMMGLRRCLLAVCGAIHPAAGPLRTPAAGGLRFTPGEAAGLLDVQILAVGAATPARTTVAHLHAP